MPTDYGSAHQTERKRWEPTIDNGDGWCNEPICLEEREGRGRWINPATPWDLAHDRTTGQWRGPAHARCNRAEGASYGNKRRGHAPKYWTL